MSWIDLEGVANMRDLGGLPVRSGGRIRSRVLIRSDNLQGLTPAAITTLVSEFGVSDVVDLRTNAERSMEGPAPLEATAVRHHHHSLVAEQTVAEEGAASLVWRTERADSDSVSSRPDDWAEHYLGYLTRRPDSASSALDVVANAPGAVIVHCAAGKDRTGTIVALALDVAGVPHEAIAADYDRSSERLLAILDRLAVRPAYSDLLNRAQAAQEQVPDPSAVLDILATLAEDYGGAAGWLRSQGWSADQLDRLRDRLVDAQG